MSLKPRSYQDKVVWITGASSGIGAALASAFAAREATLVLSARRRDRLEAVRTACTHAERHRILPLDLTEAAAIPTAVDSVLSQQGRVDILVNNGGITQRSLVKDTRIEVDRRIMETNYFGAVALTKAVLPSMLACRSGDIVVVSSLIGHFSTPLRSAYAASKHALHGFFDALRAEVYADGLHVMLVCPGFVRTEISLHALTADGSSPTLPWMPVRLGAWRRRNAPPKSLPASTGAKKKSSLGAGRNAIFCCTASSQLCSGARCAPSK